MATAKQILANRLNALKGGPKTEQGKAAVRLNAVSHGLLSAEVLLPGEDSRRLTALRQQTIAELLPEGELETLMVERIVSSFWRLRRAVRLEKTKTKDGGDYRADSWQYLMRYETALERQIYKALRELRVLQTARLARYIANASLDDREALANEASRQVKDFFLNNEALFCDRPGGDKPD
jgi:hypothetical protein